MEHQGWQQGLVKKVKMAALSLAPLIVPLSIREKMQIFHLLPDKENA